MVRTLLLYCFLTISTICYSQTVIKPVISEIDSIKKPLNEISCHFIRGGYIKGEDKVVWIRTQKEMKNFNSQFEERTSSCPEVTSKQDFQSHEIIFVGMSLGGNEKLDVNFSFENETLVIIITVISPENIDLSNNPKLHYFLVDKKYFLNTPVCRLDRKIIRSH
ncbi:hypothetical protein CNR22_11620 [Sphingobacteriaceae bacterium]|nr:hypothetical protein CNR22_11620 [Sphingobacteriaceae bacterium]